MLALIHRFRSDEALMQSYQGGDVGAFECLYHRHKDALFAFLYRSCPRRDVVEELCQDSWAAVVNRAPDYRADANFRTWLYRIARNRLADFWRRRDNSHDRLEQVPEPAADNSGAEEDVSALLMTAIGQLPPAQRDTLLLHEQGFSHAEIASITDAGEETVKSRLRYARAQLREQRESWYE